MIMAVQYLLAFLTTLKYLPLFTTFYRSLRLATLASYDGSFIITRLALSRVANISAIMRAVSSSFLSTDFSARMCFEVTILFRIKVFSTIAVVFGHGLVILKVALWAFPIEDDMRLLVELLVDVLNPLLDAFKMHGDTAAGTGPYPIFPSDVLSADNAIMLVMTALSLLELRRF